MGLAVPKVNDVSVSELVADPYPVFERLRAMAPVVWVEAANINLVMDPDCIRTIESDPATFASTNSVSLMNKVMGHSLMRKDHEDHRVERAAIQRSFNPKVVKSHWSPRFKAISAELIDDFVEAGRADLFEAYAAPFASRCLIEVLGLTQLDWRDVARWSQALMDGVANYGADPDIARVAAEASQSIDDAIEHAIAQRPDRDDLSVLSSLLQAKSPHSIGQIRANVKVIIGGGLNEPRDAILSSLLGLLQMETAARKRIEDGGLFKQVFEEAVRWISPIGMYPRRVTCSAELGGMALQAEDQLGVCVGAANRDPASFEAPDVFDPFRNNRHHLAFGAGPHFCAGTWMSRSMVGETALPDLVKRLPGLTLVHNTPADVRGWVFRGPVKLPVEWR